MLYPVLHREATVEVDGVDPWQWPGFLGAAGKHGSSGCSRLAVDGDEALRRSFDISPSFLDVPVKSGDQTFDRVVFHLEMNGGGDRDELREIGSLEDALIEGWEVHHQELGLDGSGCYPPPKGDDQLHVPPWLRAGPVETLKIKTRVGG